MKDSDYNREKVWGDLYRKFDEDPQKPTDEENAIREGRRSFAELFEARGMKGFDASEKVSGEKASEKQKTRYPANPQDSLDLHGLTIVSAEREIQKFIRQARERGLVFVIIIPGKGINSEGGESKLRPLSIELLNKMIPEHQIKSFRSAEPRHGGFGALYVYLK